MHQLWDLFIAFTRASNLGFGGGPAVIPLIQAETVDRYHWMSIQEFTDALAVSNALPGPIATKMAGYIGYKVAGWSGVFVSLMGAIFPTLLVVVFLSGLLMKFSNSPHLNGMLKSVRPVVVVLVAETVLSMGRNSFPDISTWIIAVLSIVALYLFNIHPAILIISAMVYGYFVFS